MNELLYPTAADSQDSRDRAEALASGGSGVLPSPPSRAAMEAVASAVGFEVEVVDPAGHVAEFTTPGNGSLPGPLAEALGGGGALAIVESDNAATTRMPTALPRTTGGVEPGPRADSNLGERVGDPGAA